MDPKENYDSLDKQVNDTFRQRPRMGFLKKTAAVGAAILSSLGCISRYEIMSVRSPDAIPQKVADYGKRLERIAEQMKLYDSKTGNYDFGRIKSEAENQTATREYTHPKTKQKITAHPNLRNYNSIDQLYATKRALGMLIEQNKDYIETNKNDSSKNAEVMKMMLDNEELNKLRGKYDSALREYNLVNTGNPKKTEEEREKSSLALEVSAIAASKDFKLSGKLAEKRREELGRLGPSESYDEVAMRDPEGVREAHKVYNQMLAGRRKNKNTAIWSAIGAGLIYALCHDDGEGIPGSIGGEEGEVGGR